MHNFNSFCYLVAGFYHGISYIQQYRGVMAQFFNNNYPKPVKTLKTAIKQANISKNKWRLDCVKVYKMERGSHISSSAFDINNTQEYNGKTVGEGMYKLIPTYNS